MLCFNVIIHFYKEKCFNFSYIIDINSRFFFHIVSEDIDLFSKTFVNFIFKKTFLKMSVRNMRERFRIFTSTLVSNRDLKRVFINSELMLAITLNMKIAIHYFSSSMVFKILTPLFTNSKWFAHHICRTQTKQLIQDFCKISAPTPFLKS